MWRTHGVFARSAMAGILALALGGAARANVLFETGFNDASGINSDGTIFSPYQVNLKLNGQISCGIEPGWGGSVWSQPTGSVNDAFVESTSHEGDQGLRLSNYAEVRRYFPGVNSLVYLDVWVQVDTLPTGGSTDVSVGDGSTDQATGVRLNADGTLEVIGGPSTAQFNFLDQAWHRVTQELDVAGGKTRVWFDTVLVAGGPFSFAGAVATLTQTGYSTNNESGNKVYWDEFRMTDHNPMPELNIIPEPAGLGWLGLVLLAARRPKRD